MSDEIIKIIQTDDTRKDIQHVPIIGERTLHLVSTLKVSDKSKETVISEACEILSHCTFPSEQGNSTNIAVGYVQSGKTMSFTVLSALAADNGFKIIIYLTGTKTNLQNQTFRRLKKELSFNDDFTKYKLFEDDIEASTQTIYRIQNFINLKDCVLLFPILKHYQHINDLADVFQSPSIRGLLSNQAVLIIDDEADQSSFNTYARKNSNKKEWEEDLFSRTYSSILNLRASFPCHSYVQYTATPQAAFLIDANDILSPDFHTVLTPGDGYTGGKFFFKNSNRYFVKIIPDEEVYHYKRNPLAAIPDSLEDALQQFLISVAIVVFIQKREPFLSMMIHVDGRRDTNELFTLWTQAVIQRWLDLLNSPEKDPGRMMFIESLKKPFDEITKYINTCPSFEEVVNILPIVLMMNHTRLVQGANSSNGSSDNNEIHWEDDPSHILIGADMLNRGFTIEKLSMTYMPRESKGKATADTIEQRCRFFGYKMNYADVCRIYISEKSRLEYIGYVEHEEILRTNLKQCKTIAEFARMTKAMVLTNRLNPTRNNILSSKLVTGKMSGWRSLLSLDYLTENHTHVKNLISSIPNDKFTYFEAYPNNVQRNHRYVKMDIDSFIDFFRKFQYKDAPNIMRKVVTIQYLNYLKESMGLSFVYVIEMAYDAEHQNDIRTRRIRNNKPINLMVGVSPNGKLLGDDEYKFEDSICFQLHHFQIKDAGIIGNKKAYNITVYYPEKLEQAFVALNDNDEIDDDDDE